MILNLKKSNTSVESHHFKLEFLKNVTKMGHFVIIVNYHHKTLHQKSILDVAAVLDPPPNDIEKRRPRYGGCLFHYPCL